MYLSRDVNILQNCPLPSVVFVGFKGSFRRRGNLPLFLRDAEKDARNFPARILIRKKSKNVQKNF